MKSTLFLRNTLPSLFIIANLAFSANLSHAGVDITYPGASLVDGDLYPENSFSGNTVTITEGEIQGHVYGAYSVTETIQNNHVFMKDGYVANGVFGGNSELQSVSGNSVTITGGSVTLVYGGYSSQGIVSGNSITISGGSFKKVYGGHSWKGETISGNSAIISGGSFTAIYGGDSWEGSVSGNSVTISGGTSGHACGGFTRFGDSTGNSVTVSGGSVASIYGGYSTEGIVSGNSVTISGGSVASVYGGWAYENDATGNSVTLTGDADVSEALIFGGHSQMKKGDERTGNTFRLDHFHGQAKNISNFDRIEIRTSSWTDDMFTLTDGNPTDLSNTTVSIHFSALESHSLLNVGDSISLIRNSAGINSEGLALENSGQQRVRGAGSIYDLAFSVTEDSIRATIISRGINEQGKSLSEGRQASLAHLNIAGDLIAEQGLQRAVQAGMQGSASSGFDAFYAMAGTHSRYDTGSSVDLYGYSALAGISHTPSACRGAYTLALFAETGWGHYSSFNSFADSDPVRGWGDTSYYGGGIMMRRDFSCCGIKGLALDASFRTGRADTAFRSGDLNNARYKIASPYYGAHAGVTYARRITAVTDIAAYSRFYWLRQEGDQALVDGDRFRFRNTDSRRIRTGARLLWEAAPSIRPYAGAAYEWECSGTARSTVGGEALGSPSLRGGTGMGELGVLFQPVAGKPVFIDAGVQGYTGKREGIGGSVQVRVQF